MQKAQNWIGEYRRFWEASFDRLDAYLAEMQQRGVKSSPQNKNAEKNTPGDFVPEPKPGFPLPQTKKRTTK